MRQNTHFLLLFWFLILANVKSNGQNVHILVLDQNSKKPIADAKVFEYISGTSTYTDQLGSLDLTLSLNQSEIQLFITHPDYEDFNQTYTKALWNSSGLMIELTNKLSTNIDLATIQIEASDDVNQSESEVYSLLSSSEDPILQATAYEFSALRFRNRGIDTRYDQLGFNGFLLNDLGTGMIPYNLLSGQTQITKYANPKFSYPVQAFDFGSAGNNQWIDCNPESYRKGLVINYSLSNRSYRNRFGIHYAGRVFSDKINLIVGGNRRWAQEGVFPGTFYDAYGLYLGLSRRFGQNSKLSFVCFYSPVTRGKSAPVLDEVVELRGDNLYNPYWGYQEGKKRNSRVSSTSVPAFLLNYNLKYSKNSSHAFGFMFSKGKRSNSNLDWYNVSDPRPDYYQYLPSAADNDVEKSLIENAWKSDISVYQINWNKFYQTNYQNYEWVKNINGSTDSLYGRRSLYALSDSHFDPLDIEIFESTSFKLKHNQFVELLGRFEFSNTKYYQKLNDLLGGDYFIDYGKFVTSNYNKNPNIQNVNHIVRVGDVYAFDYSIHSTKFSLQQAYSAKFRKIDFNLGLQEEIVWINLFRNYQNLIFINSNPQVINNGQNGLNGKFNLGAKSNIVYKRNGRNYFELGTALHRINPSSDQIYINPAWRYDILPVNDQTQIGKIDLSYKYKSPEFRLALTGFYYQFNHQIKSRNFYLDASAEEQIGSDLLDGGFVNGFYTGLNEVHRGIEASVSWDVNSVLQINVVGQKGEYYYSSRPTYYYYDQFSPSSGNKIIYLRNFYVPGTPQSVFSGSVKYSFTKSAFATLSINYLARSFVEINPLRRISEAVDGIEPNSQLFSKIINQEKLPSALLLNAVIFKNFNIFNKFTSVSLNINNLLNREDLISGGFEQSRFDYTSKDVEKFPNKYFHLQGINFFFNINISLN